MGMMILFGPPTVGMAGYWLALKGQCTALHRWRLSALPERTVSSNAMSVGALVGAYQLQLRAMVRHFDEGGALSMNWKQGVDSLGKPFEIKTWGQFYRACGPPVIARVGAMMVSCYLAGWASTSVRALAAKRGAARA